MTRRQRQRVVNAAIYLVVAGIFAWTLLADGWGAFGHTLLWFAGCFVVLIVLVTVTAMWVDRGKP